MNNQLFASIRNVAWLIAGAGLAASSSGCALDCTDRGCENNVRATFEVADLSAFDGAQISVCVNKACDVGKVTVADGNMVCAFGKDLLHGCQVRGTGKSSSIEVDIDIGQDDPGAGDHIAVAFRSAADDKELAAREGDVKYEEYHPNGPNCDGTCYSAAL